MSREEYVRFYERLFDSFEYLRMEFETLEPEVVDELGLAWGPFIEDFQLKRKQPEWAGVRFSQVMRQDEIDSLLTDGVIVSVPTAYENFLELFI